MPGILSRCEDSMLNDIDCKPEREGNRDGHWVVEYYHGQPHLWSERTDVTTAMKDASEAASGDHGADVVYQVSGTRVRCVFRKQVSRPPFAWMETLVRYDMHVLEFHDERV